MASHSEIMHQVFSHMYGLVVVDHQARVVFIEENYAKAWGLEPEKLIGKYIRDFIPTSKLPNVVESGKPILGDVFYSEGKPLICNRFPLVKDGVIIGAISFQVFEVADKLFDTVKELRAQLDYYKEKIKKYSGARYCLGDIAGDSVPILSLRSQILQAAAMNSTVLLQGETGTGKEIVAHALHQESRRAHSPFVKINCAAIPHELLESELFGYDEGAFTGARRSGKKGKFELANKGTLFLDEVSQLSMADQAKLLRVLQEKEIERVGGSEPIPVDVWIIAATNDNLEQMVAKGLFRTDLYYRLNVMLIKIAPLRERKSDIPILVAKFVEKYSEQAGLASVKVSVAAMRLLHAYDWPGNIRELEHAVERAINQCRGNVLDASHFEWLELKILNKGKNVAGQTIHAAKAESEKEVIMNALKATQGNKKKASELLNIARPLLYQKMKRLGLATTNEPRQ